MNMVSGGYNVTHHTAQAYYVGTLTSPSVGLKHNVLVALPQVTDPAPNVSSQVISCRLALLVPGLPGSLLTTLGEPAEARSC